MSIFKKMSAGGLMDEIRCDEKSYLIWKWHPLGSQVNFNDRENAIRWGSSLRVKDGEVAVFVYNQKNGVFQDFIVGPYDEKIKTENFPIFTKLFGLAFDGGTPFQAEVYFINTAKINQIKFGVPFFDVYDPRFPDFGVPVAIRGTISFRIENYKEFVKLNRLFNFDLNDFYKQIRDTIIRYAKNVVTNITAANNIPLIQIETKISQVNDQIENDIKERMAADFGVVVSGVDISAIEIDKTSNGFRQLMEITKDITSATVKTETEVKLKTLQDKQRIDIKNYEETLRIQREENQYAQHKATQTSNFAVYQTEAQKDVGIAGANALGNMSKNGSANIDLGNNTSGFNPVSIMAGMALGGTIGQNIAGTVNEVMSGAKSQITPPPIPNLNVYYIAVNGKPAGPYDINTLKSMIVSGNFSKTCLIWKQGMDDWQPINSVKEFSDIFVPIPPIPAEQ